MITQVLVPEGNIQAFEAVAAKFEGVVEPLRGVSKIVLEKLAETT